MTLEDEITLARRQIQPENISMSVGELSSLYKEGTLVIRPEFQRLLRWDVNQKSRLVESILLGIPLPSLFVAQGTDGKWELVDGLQRSGTILELQGLLRDDAGTILPPLTLKATKYLPSLEGKQWDSGDPRESLTEAQRLDIRFARLDIRIIKRDSDPQAKFDLFQRLNSFGSALTGQEIRSALIAGTNDRALKWLQALAAKPHFVSTVPLSDRLIDEQYNLELVLRFLMLHNRDFSKGTTGLGDFSTRLDEWSIDFASDFPRDKDALEKVFDQTFTFIQDHGSEDIFRKWNASKERFQGAFLNTSFEALALGVGYQFANALTPRDDLEEAARELFTTQGLGLGFSTGLATESRLAKTVPIGRKITSNPPKKITAKDLQTS